MTDFFDSHFTISTFHDGLVAKEFSVAEVAEAFFSRIQEKDSIIHSFVDVYHQEGLDRARELDKDLTHESPLLYGVPIAVKDNILIQGTRATSASKILEHYNASYDATVIRALRDQGVLMVGKTNLDEFAMGSSTENSVYGPTKNPLDITKVPGGSSGGSAAAVCASFALGALGSDTGGSIRQPAAFCGIAGFKPTYGAVSRYGLMALSSSLDQIGPFGKTVDDVAHIFEAIAGHDAHDATSWEHNWSSEVSKNASFKGITLGVPQEYFIDGMSQGVREAVEKTIERCKDLGAIIKPIHLPHTQYALSCYYIILPAEASANLGRYDGIRYSPLERLSSEDMNLLSYYMRQRGDGIGDEPRRRILLGTFVLSSGYYDAYYAKAQKVRRLIQEDFLKAFNSNNDGVDAILTPVTPTTAFGLNEKTNDPLAMYLSDVFTIPANLAGLPALSFPTGLSADGMPVNAQLIGPHKSDGFILGLGRAYEKHYPRFV